MRQVLDQWTKVLTVIAFLIGATLVVIDRIHDVETEVLSVEAIAKQNAALLQLMVDSHRKVEGKLETHEDQPCHERACYELQLMRRQRNPQPPM